MTERRTVQKSWDAYAALCSAAADDPGLANDPAYILARQRAHQRWSKSFVEWDGR